ncbi:hypothetical protein C1H46_024623 [Malus baccata]|uniref:Uncharacterized protein n=1 Tax=Malus baccata TaxID=106549 RepID=A0A540LU13_MALBA|nr:hypothetical protein C1H46_024623 [Malus baccata]
MWVGSHQPFEQPHAPAKADWEIAVEKLLLTPGRLGDTQASLDNLVQRVEQLMHQWDEHEEDNFPCQQIDGPQDLEEWCFIQTPQCVESYDYLQEDARIEEPPGIDSRPMEETANLKIPTEPLATQIYMPHILFQRCRKALKLPAHTKGQS